MMYLIFIIAIKSILLYLGSGELQQKFVLSEKEGFLFLSVYNVTSDEENIYVSDQKGFALYKISKNGKLIKKTGRKGEGPGEFLTGPANLCLSNDTLYVCDGSGIRIVHLFTKELNYIKSYRINIGILDIQANNNRFYIASRDYYGTPYIAIYNSKFKEIKKMYLNNPAKVARANDIHLLVTDSDDMIVIYKYRNLIQYYNSEWNMYEEINIEGIPKVVKFEVVDKIKNTISKSIDPKVAEYFYTWPKGIIFRKVFLTHNGNILLQTGDSNCFIVNKYGKKLNYFRIKKDSDVLHIDKSNEIYLVNDSFTTLTKYELK